MRALEPRVSQLYTAAILYMKSQNSITIIFTIKSLFKSMELLKNIGTLKTLSEGYLLTLKNAFTGTLKQPLHQKSVFDKL